mmetsp:Transcript_12290/g.20708  ORF Transcript_12290/g.20708 Transcript_12290/m.20708 type:complete len:564 (-) Transcript_12290:533-2224(-)
MSGWGNQIEQLEEQIAALHSYMATQDPNEAGNQLSFQNGVMETVPQDHTASMQYRALQAMQAGWMAPKQSRWNITRGALELLEQAFAMDKFPSLFVRQQLANELNVSCRQVQVWFQNRRQRERNLNRERGIEDEDLVDHTLKDDADYISFVEECKNISQHAQKLSATLDRVLSDATDQKHRERGCKPLQKFSENPGTEVVQSPVSSPADNNLQHENVRPQLAQVVSKSISSEPFFLNDFSAPPSPKPSIAGLVVAATPAKEILVAQPAKPVPAQPVLANPVLQQELQPALPTQSLATMQEVGNPNVQMMPVEAMPSQQMQWGQKRSRSKKTSEARTPGPLDMIMAKRHQATCQPAVMQNFTSATRQGLVPQNQHHAYQSPDQMPMSIQTISPSQPKAPSGTVHYPAIARPAPPTQTMLLPPQSCGPQLPSSGSVPTPKVPPGCDPVTFATMFATAMAHATYACKSSSFNQVDVMNQLDVLPYRAQEEESICFKHGSEVETLQQMANWSQLEKRPVSGFTFQGAEADVSLLSSSDTDSTEECRDELLCEFSPDVIDAICGVGIP